MMACATSKLKFKDIFTLHPFDDLEGELPLASGSFCCGCQEDVNCLSGSSHRRDAFLGLLPFVLFWALDLQVLPMVWVVVLFLISMKGAATGRLLYDNILVVYCGVNQVLALATILWVAF